MKLNFIEGLQNKTESGLREILFAQAKVRLYVAVPVIISDLMMFFLTPGGVPLWFLCLTSAYCAYALSPYQLIRKSSYSALQYLLIATAIFDPVVLSIWIVLTGEYGSLVAGFYLFTTLGFGFRTGRPLMHLCQMASIICFALILLYDPYWQQHGVFWVALLVPLIIVPMYAGKLITTLRASREQAELESRGKSELLAKVSHELRTPLTGIVAAAELLAIESSDQLVIQRTDTILALSDNLLQEINDLLDQAKFESQIASVSFAPTDLRQQLEILSNTFDMMAAKKEISFQLDIDTTIVDSVDTDAHHLDRILLNLVGNAIKFTSTGGVNLAVQLFWESKSEYRIRFSVTDTGIGIPESFHKKMWQPFSQVEEGVNRRYGGTGLGLALSKKIVELMGGEILFTSAVDQGSCFWFDLKLQRVAIEPLTLSEPISPEIVSAKRILVAEDNVTNLLLLKELLEIDHHHVTTCTSGMEALELLAKHDFDLLLLDYNLGDMDGIRVLQTYQFGRLRTAPALFLTADATTQTATRLKATGSAGVLYKPINLAVLRKALAYIEVHSSEDAPLSTSEPIKEIAPPARNGRPALTVVPINALDPEILDELREVSARPEFLPILLTQAEHDIVRSCQQLVEALAGRNYTSIRDTAHALKGVCANVGAVRLVALAGNLMIISSHELESSCERLATDLRDASRMTVNALRKAVAETPTASTSSAGSLHLD